MNTLKIAALMPYFFDCLRHVDSGQSLEDMMVKRLQSDGLSTHYRYSITLTDMDNPGQYTDYLSELAGATLYTFTTARVWAWAAQQVENRTQEYHPAPATGWNVYLQGGPREKKPGGEETMSLWGSGSAEELAHLLRGLRAQQAKGRKLARRLIAQCWAYHWQQEREKEAAARQLVATAERHMQQMQADDELAATTPLCCLHIPAEEYDRRVDAAEALHEAKCEANGKPEARYGREILWHPLFAAEYVATTSNLPLYEVAHLQGVVLESYNQYRALDRYDYAYLADILREALAEQPGGAAALRLGRALEWVELAAGRLLAAPVVRSLPTAPAEPLLALAA